MPITNGTQRPPGKFYQSQDQLNKNAGLYFFNLQVFYAVEPLLGPGRGQNSNTQKSDKTPFKIKSYTSVIF